MRQRSSTTIFSGRINRAIVKALYRPASFFRGFLFPFFETKNPILKQAEIIASVLAKRSFPNTHGAAAIFHCCGLQYSGILNVILKALVDKKFMLPKIAVDKLCEWFVKFDMRENIKKPLPLLWYQTLAGFVKHYGGRINSPFIPRTKTGFESPRQVEIST